MIEFKNLSGKRVRYGAYKKLYKKIFYKSGNSFWLSAVFAPPSLMRRLNKKYRGKNKPANVLSFLLEKNLPGRQTGTGEIFLNAFIVSLIFSTIWMESPRSRFKTRSVMV